MVATSRSSTRQSGLTFIELTIVASILALVISGALSGFLWTMRGFTENQIQSQLQLRAQHAMERLSVVLGQGVSGDPAFSPLKPTSGVDSKVMRLRLIESMAGGVPVYDDAARVYVIGDDTSTYPCSGVTIGRGPSLKAVYDAAKGADNILGTRDDDTNVQLAPGIPAVELVLPDIYAPSTGTMFSLDVDPNGRLLTVTLRVNARVQDGSFLLPQDLVLRQRIALLQ